MSADTKRTERLARKGELAPKMAEELGVPQQDVQRELVTQATGEDAWHTQEAMMEEQK